MSGIDKPDDSTEEEPAAGSTSSADPALSGDEAAEVESELESEQEPEPEPDPEPSALDLLTAERDQHLNDLQRITAEFANFRKQTEKRNAETVRQAAARVMHAILPVLDACDAAALQQVEGVEPITAQLKSVLEAQGLEIIDQTETVRPQPARSGHERTRRRRPGRTHGLGGAAHRLRVQWQDLASGDGEGEGIDRSAIRA